MLLEAVVVELLNRYIGDYVENLDRKQFNIGIWSGDIVLQDLIIKQSAINDLNLPVQMVFGRLGKLVLKIPWKKLYTEPFEAIVERLYLVLVPNQEVQYDPAREDKLAQESKQAELSRIDAAKKKADEEQSVSKSSLTEKITTQAIKNITIRIKNIHIRYEDKVTNPEKPFALGLTLSNLSVETTDEQWQDANKGIASKIYKLLNLDALAMYWNCNCPMYAGMPAESIIDYFEDGIATRDYKPNNYLYMLGPINSEARLRLNPKPENDELPFTLSKMLLNLEMEKLAICISKNQYQDLMMLADSMDRMSRGMPYRKYRPFATPYKQHYREWWQFAFKCVLEEDIRRRRRNWDWTHMAQHRSLCREYAEAYQTKLQNKKIPVDVKAKITEGEKILDVFNLVIIRQRIELEVARLEKKSEEARKKGTWFSNWFGRSATDDDRELSAGADIMKKFEEAMTAEEKAKLYRAIDYQENSAPAEYPEPFVATSCTFVLRCLEIEVRDDSLEVARVLSMELKGVKCLIQQRPAANALKVAVKIDQLTVFGLQQLGILPTFVSSEDFSEGKVLLDVMFETNPLDKQCDQRLHLKSQPLKVIYDAQTIVKIVDVFKVPQSIALEQLQAVAGNKLADWKEMSATGLQHAVQQHVTMDLDINLSAPYVIIPHGGLYTSSKTVLVVNLGCVKVKSIVRDTEQMNIRKMHREGTTEDMILREIMSQSYDKFLCELTDMQILIANEWENWRTGIQDNAVTPMHLLQPVNLTVNINKCLVQDDPRLPKIKIAGQLPSIALNISDDRLLALMSLAASIPLPNGDKTEPAPLQYEVSRSSLFLPEGPTKRRDSKPQTKSVEQDAFIQATDLDVKFEMKELVVTISKKQNVTDVTEPPEKVIQFRCMLLELDLIQQTFNLDVMIRLGGIGLTQYRPLNQIQMIDTPMAAGKDEYLFTVQFIQVDKKSPEFHSKYMSCEQRLQLNFTSIRLQLHQEGLQLLLQTANDFQQRLEAGIKPVESGHHVVSAASKTKRLSTVPEGAVMTAKLVKQIARKPKKVLIETIAFKLTATMAELDIVIANDSCELASLAVKGVKADIVVKKSYTQIIATLSDLTILDSNPLTKHTMILCKTGTEDALSAQIVMYNLDKEVDVNQNDMSITVTMSGLKITFLNLFVTAILDFLNKFQAAQQAIIDASAAAAEQAKQNMQNAYQNATRIELNIKLKAPEIIMPTNSQSYDAILVDLGNIILSNRFLNMDAHNETGNAAVVDDLKLNLMDVQMSRIMLDEQLNRKCECTLLKPLSFVLRIKRNLSASWYNNIPDLDVAGEMKAIELMISEMDYSKIMQIVNENLSEGVDTKAKPAHKSDVGTPGRTPRAVARSESMVSRVTIEEKKPDKQAHIFLRFTFTMESLVINLFKGGTETLTNEEENLVHAPKDGLARFTMLVLSLKGRILTDDSITTSILLVDCLLDDTRIGREGKLTRLMERREDSPDDFDTSGNISIISTDVCTRSMIDITFQKKNTDMFVDVRVYSFNMILSMDYLMKVGAFFSTPSTAPATEAIKTQKPAAVKSRVDSRATQSVVPPEQAEPAVPETNMTLNLKIEKPDIILVEHMDNIDTNALILNNEVLLNVRLAGKNQSIRGSITDLQLYTCCYNPAKRNETKCPVLRPCHINVQGATPENQGLHLEVVLSDIRLSVSPAIIELLTRVQSTMCSSDSAAVQNAQEVTCYTDIWQPAPFVDSNFWFLKTEEAQEATETMATVDYSASDNRPVPQKEMCNVSALSIVVTVEAGVGTKTVPMLLLETSFEASVHDWSSKMYIDSSLTMQMAYYNSRLAVWEPLIEPVEIMHDNRIIHAPWELKVELRMNEQEEQYVMSPQGPESEAPEEISFTPPTMSINVSSSVNMELVVTKTFLEVIGQLGKAFANAMKDGVLVKEGGIVPYKVVNDSGLKVTLMLENSVFQVFSGDMLSDYREVVLESGAEVPLELTPEQDSNVSLHLAKSMSAYSMLHKVDDKDLIVYVNDMKCTLSLPVVRADKRYFPLNYRGENKDQWGIISDVTVQGAETIVTLRSMLQVHNHFNQPVNVYYMTNRGNELECIKKVPPGASFNLPMNAVYTLTNELFFSVEGHCVTAVPYVWKDLQHNLSMMKNLTCPSDVRHGGQPFVMKVCGDIEQIYYENTNRHTMVSTCYNIHLRPAITFKNCLPIPVICIIQGDVEEVTVQPGEQLHMNTVNPGSSYIVIRLGDYLDKEWSCRRDIPPNPLEFSVWQFDSHDSVAKMSLDLGMHCRNKHGTMVLSLYCPFWMLNKTGVMLSYRKSSKAEKNQAAGSPAKNSDESLNILHHPEDFKGPILFSFSAKNFFGKKKASIRMGAGDWSDKFSLDVAGSSGVVSCKTATGIHQIGVHNQLTYNGLTKQVTFTPYFVLINNASYAIECQELERPADPWVVVKPNACTALWPRADRDDKLLKVRVDGTTEITAPFLITDVHTTLLKLANKYGGINVDVQITEGGIYVTFTPYQPGLAPALIINHTKYEVTLWEKESVNLKRLEPKHRLLHTWENPTGPRMLLWETEKKKELEDDLRKDGLGEFSLEPDSSVFWVSFLDGMQRVLLFTEDMDIAKDAQSAGDLENIQQEITVSIHGLGVSLVNNLIRQEIMYIGIASSGIIWEACKLSSKRYKQLSVKECLLIEGAYQHYLLTVCGDATSTGTVIVDQKIEVDFRNELMVRPHRRRIRRAFQTGLWLQMKTSPNQLQLHAKINRVQIDNQMCDCIFPVVLAPVPPPKSVAADSALKPFAELSIVQRVMKHSTLQQYKYFKVLIQEFHIKVDLGFVNAIMAVLEAEEPSEHDEAQLFVKDMSLVDEPLLAHVSTQSLQEQKNFYDLLHFSPLKIHVSFSLAAPPASGSAQTGAASQSSTPAFLNVLLQGLGVTLTDMQDVVFRLAYFEREYSFLTQRKLMSEATTHYVGQAVKQLYVLVLGLDVIGNPYGLVLGLTKGVEDLFYEPFQGAIQGPGEFAEGLVLGVRSLFGHTVGGAAGAVSRITGAMGKGIAALTFDKDYQRKRRDQINKKPANLQEGIARGGKGLVMGVVDGVTGVFTKPITGAKEQGVEGFFKGLGKGAVGLVTRPTAGVIDFASGSLDAVKRAAEMGDDVLRLRAPRFMRADGLVRPYVKQDAEGNKLLTELEKGKYANTDVYAFHTWIVERKDILLLTDKRMAYVIHNDLFGGWQVEWAYTWKEIQIPAKVVDRGVQVTTGEPKKKVLGLFGSGENGKIIIIADRALREVVRDKIEALRQNA